MSLRLSVFENREWQARGRFGPTAFGDSLECAPEDLPRLCEALNLVPRKALQIAVGYHVDGMIAMAEEDSAPFKFRRADMVKLGVQRALREAAVEPRFATGLQVPPPEPEPPCRCHCGRYIYIVGWRHFACVETNAQFCNMCGDKLLDGGCVERHQAEVRGNASD